MEGFLGLLLIGALIFWRPLLRILFGAGQAGLEVATKGGDFGDRWKQNVVGLGPLEVRAQTIPKTGDDDFPLIEIQARGLFPVTQRTQVQFLTSVRDETDPKTTKAIFSRVDDFTEPMTVGYQFASPEFEVQPDYGFRDWARVGVLIPPIMVPPYGGVRKLRIILRFVDANNVPEIELGLHDPDGPSAIKTLVLHETWKFEEKGYEEAAQQRDQQKALFVELAVAVAMADGSFDSREGVVVKKWIERQLSTIPAGRREAVKDACNASLRSGFERGKQGAISLSNICNAIVACSDTSERYEAIELCLDVMAADGRADASELKIIRQVANVLELDLDELKKLKDQRMVSLAPSIEGNDTQQSLEEILDIDPKWPRERIRKHLRDEFKVWNGRLNNLKDSGERANAQRMIDLISEARRKYE